LHPIGKRVGKEGDTRPGGRWWEGTLGWLSKCRAILARYEKKAANYLGLIKVARVLLKYRRQHRLFLSGQLLAHYGFYNQFSVEPKSPAPREPLLVRTIRRPSRT
jgi:hypothetical protein